ncbi:MAG TPA: twin-arginine translocase TatA/TatE family subunit [Opitutaceae bacterium]|nr:twin-arginine translocase TatA/TatE family subunit [Opitutaceae bacterium]
MASLTLLTSSTFGLIGDIGGPELMLIFVLVLLLFGGKKLPEFARGLGKSIREFKKATSGVEEEIRRAMDEAPPPRKRTAALPAATVTPTLAAPTGVIAADYPDDPHHGYSDSTVDSDPHHSPVADAHAASSDALNPPPIADSVPAAETPEPPHTPPSAPKKPTETSKDEYYH